MKTVEEMFSLQGSQKMVSQEQMKSKRISFHLVLDASQSMTANNTFISKNAIEANDLDNSIWTQWSLNHFVKHHVILVVIMDFIMMDLFIALVVLSGR